MEIPNLRDTTHINNPAELAKRRRRNSRYRSDEDFRLKYIDAVKRRHRTNLCYESYRKLVAIRKRIYWQRERINNWLNKLASAERKLEKFLQEKELLEKEWKAEKNAKR